MIDDRIFAKSFLEASKLASWHYDHIICGSIKGIIFLTAIYQSKEMSIPVGIEFVESPLYMRMKRQASSDLKA